MLMVDRPFGLRLPAAVERVGVPMTGVSRVEDPKLRVRPPGIVPVPASVAVLLTVTRPVPSVFWPAGPARVIVPPLIVVPPVYAWAVDSVRLPAPVLTRASVLPVFWVIRPVNAVDVPLAPTVTVRSAPAALVTRPAPLRPPIVS